MTPLGKFHDEDASSQPVAAGSADPMLPQTPAAGTDTPTGTPSTAAEQVDPTQMVSVNARLVVLIGTAGFALALLVMLPFWGWLGDHHHRIWLWTALSGTVLGLLGLPLIGKHSRQGRLGDQHRS